MAGLNTSHTLVLKTREIRVEAVVVVASLIIAGVVRTAVPTVTNKTGNAIPSLGLQARLAFRATTVIVATQAAVDLAKHTSSRVS